MFESLRPSVCIYLSVKCFTWLTFFRVDWPILTKLGTIHSIIKGFTFVKMNSHSLFHWAIIWNYWKFIGIFKRFFQTSFGQKSWNLFEASRFRHVDLNFKIIIPKDRLGASLGVDFYTVINRKKCLTVFSETIWWEIRKLVS